MCEDTLPVVKVYDRTSDQILELSPKKVWILKGRNSSGIKIGLFKSPITGKYFRARLPDNYKNEC